MIVTMAEFITMYGLGVDIRDSGATRLIAKKLRENGYTRVKKRHKGTVQWVWMKEDKNRLHNLNTKLEVIDLP